MTDQEKTHNVWECILPWADFILSLRIKEQNRGYVNSRCQETQRGGLPWLKYSLASVCTSRPGFDICVSQSNDRFERRVYQMSEEPVSHWATSSHPEMRQL